MAPRRAASPFAAALLAFGACITVVCTQNAVAAPRNEEVKTRCGWFINPTPGNAWLSDQDGEWTIGIQGGHQADGDWPSFRRRDWVATNRSYGHGCACMNVVENGKTKKILRILSARARPLKTCEQDPALAKPAA